VQIALARAYAETAAAAWFYAGQILLTLGDTEERRRYSRPLDHGPTPHPVTRDTSRPTSEIRYGDNDRSPRASHHDERRPARSPLRCDGYTAARRQAIRRRATSRWSERITADIEAWPVAPARSCRAAAMQTKIEAAKIATVAGTAMVIASGRDDHRCADRGRRPLHLVPRRANPVTARKTGSPAGSETSGALVIDEGAARALAPEEPAPGRVFAGRGPLPAWRPVVIQALNGAGDGPRARRLRQGHAERIAGRNSRESPLLAAAAEMIHRDDMVSVDPKSAISNQTAVKPLVSDH